MGKLFGTDGIRGVANETLDAPLAYRIGQAAALAMQQDTGRKPLFLIGRDTRISGDMLECALAAGLCACGADVMRLGVVPTPAVAYLTVCNHADAGAVISASHNPYEHNGIKLFSGSGYKLSDALEDQIEEYILSGEPLPTKTHGEIGQILDGDGQVDRYLEHLASTVDGDLRGLRVLVDCANGAASVTARRLFARVGAEAEFLHDRPDGVNINNGCGSTHLEALSAAVAAGSYDLGVAFDGDADRCLAVDERGGTVDGDQMMAICAASMTGEGRLHGNGFVATVMSNIGLHKYCKEHGVELLCAAVGDRNVLAMMQEKGMRLGGEQSGHIIFLDYMPTGDGELSALQLMQILKKSGQPLSRLAGAVTRYPQVLLNVPGPVQNAEKKALIASEAVQAAIRDGERALEGDGRILVRPSGTEALIRVMVEAGTQERAEQIAEQVAKIVESTKNCG